MSDVVVPPRAVPALRTLFALTGLVSASWSARIPAVQERTGAGSAGLALVIAAVEAGAVAGLSAGAVLTARAGSRACLRAGFVAYPLGLAAIAAAPTVTVLLPVVVLWAIANSVVDVALNAQGVELERRLGRPVMSGLHAGHSFGLIAGAGIAAVVAAADVPLAIHLPVVALACAVIGVAAAAPLVREVRRQPGRERFRLDRRVLLLGVVAFAAFGLDGTAGSWSAAHLSTGLGSGPAVAAAGYGIFAAALFAGRLAGDRLLARHGRAPVVTVAGIVAAAAVVVLVAARTAPVALAGWFLLGLAVAPMAPALLGAAPAVSRMPAATTVAATTGIGYLGSFTVPPLVGLLAAATTIGTALVLLTPLAVGAAVLATAALRPGR